MRIILMLAGLLCVGLAIVGVFVPVMPTVVFFLIAAICFAKANPAWEARIMNHAKPGPSSQAFRKRAKIASVALTVWLCGVSGHALASEYRSIGQSPLIAQTFTVGDKRMRFAAGEGELVDKNDAGRNGLPVRWLTVTNIGSTAGKPLYEEVVQDWPLGAVQLNTETGVLLTYWESATAFRIIVLRTRTGSVTKIFDNYSKTLPAVKFDDAGNLVFQLSKQCAGGSTDCRVEDYVVDPGGN